MKLSQYCILAIVSLIVGLTGTVKSEQRVRIGNPSAKHPVLNNINTIYAFVISESPDLKKTELAKRLQTAAEMKLTEAGFKIGEKADFENRPVPFGIPELRIYMEMLKIDANQSVLYTKTALAKTIYLTNRGNLYTKADLWEGIPIIQTIPAEDISTLEAKINEVVGTEVDKFIKAYKDASGSTNESASDVNNTDANNMRKFAPRVARKNVREEPNQQTVEEKYIAAKTSKIFHRPSCVVVGRIKEENQVTYNTRDEATNAGKTPCKICKP